MSRRPSNVNAVLIQLCYLLPLFTALLLLLPFLIPHLFFLQDGELTGTVSVAELMKNALRYAVANLRGTAGSGSGTVYFSAAMLLYGTVSLLLLIWHLLWAIASAGVSIYAFSVAEPNRKVNMAKRVYRMIVPNRVFFVLLAFAPLPAACFPYFFAQFCRRSLAIQTVPHFYGAPDFVYVLLAGVAVSTLFLALLGKQRDANLDLFRIYKIPSKQ